jgi:hypothetical protein
VNVPFADIEQALRHIATSERHRIEHTHWHVVRGYAPTVPDGAFAGWRERLIRIEAGHRLVSILIPHEADVRAMHEQLKVPVVPRPTTTSWEI